LTDKHYSIYSIQRSTQFWGSYFGAKSHTIFSETRPTASFPLACPIRPTRPQPHCLISTAHPASSRLHSRRLLPAAAAPPPLSGNRDQKGRRERARKQGQLMQPKISSFFKRQTTEPDPNRFVFFPPVPVNLGISALSRFVF
jgi:hypothetical protein